MKIQKFIYAAIGALTTLLVCALFSINFSATESEKGSEVSGNSPNTSSSSGMTSNLLVPERNFESLYYQSAQKILNLESQLSFCRSDLSLTRMQDFQNRNNNLRNGIR